MNPFKQRLLVTPVGGLFGEEGAHALLLVVQGEHGVEDASLEAQTFGQVQLVGSVDGLLGHGDRGAGEGRDLLTESQGALQQLR
jgi:hypothetical protein